MSGKDHFLVPTNMLVNQKSVSTPARLTLDASILPNTFLDKGINYLPRIFDLLIRFRDKPIALPTDLKHFYHRIQLHKDDRKYIRFLHKNVGHDEEIQVYQHKTMCMGFSDSVFLATSVLRKISNIIRPIDEKMADILRDSFYLDDILVSVQNTEEEIEIHQKLVRILKYFNLISHKWFTDDVEVLNQIPENLRSTSGIKKILKGDDYPESHYEIPPNPETLKETTLSNSNLGLTWCIEEKHSFITFQHFAEIAKELENTQILSRRNISASAGRFYDPLHLCSQVTLSIKLSLQLSWVITRSWDEEIIEDRSSEILDEKQRISNKIWHFFRIFVKNLYTVAKWKLPRYIIGNRIGKRQILKKMLVLSVDEGDFCRSYHLLLRVLLSNQSILTTFMTAGNRLTPQANVNKKTKNAKKTKSSLSIPRSELMSIQEGVDDLFHLIELLKIYDYIILSDSLCSIQQIRRAHESGSDQFHIF